MSDQMFCPHCNPCDGKGNEKCLKPAPAAPAPDADDVTFYNRNIEFLQGQIDKLRAERDAQAREIAALRKSLCGCVWREGSEDRERGDRPFYARIHHQELYCKVDAQAREIADLRKQLAKAQRSRDAYKTKCEQLGQRLIDAAPAPEYEEQVTGRKGNKADAQGLHVPWQQQAPTQGEFAEYLAPAPAAPAPFAVVADPTVPTGEIRFVQDGRIVGKIVDAAPAPDADGLDKKRLARMRQIASSNTPGTCRILSRGDACECSLCDLDSLLAHIAAQASQIADATLCNKILRYERERAEAERDEAQERANMNATKAAGFDRVNDLRQAAILERDKLLAVVKELLAAGDQCVESDDDVGSMLRYGQAIDAARAKVQP